MYDADASPPFISRVTNAAIEQVVEWQARPLDVVYPSTQVQFCIVHMVRNSLKCVPWKDYKAITADLKHIYQSITEEYSLMSLEQFEQRWDDKYPNISRSWCNNWQNVSMLFNYPEDIRKVIYTTNAIESIELCYQKGD